MNSTLPSIPGELVRESRKQEIRKRIKELLGVVNFPGSHPVSFTTKNLKELEEENYWVCEKTDGVRVLAFMTVNANGKPEVYLIDRKNQYRYVPHLRFPVPTDDKNFQEIFSRYVKEGLKFHKDTLIDCELVFDVEEDGTRKLKLLVFDTLIVLGKDLLKRPLSKRCGYMNDYIIKPYEKYIDNPDVACLQPFTVEIKKMEFSYALNKVLKEIIPSLKHKSDGLVFTSENAPYTIGTCEKILKWKPGNENSIDFKLKLQSSGEGKPKFNLLKWTRSDEYEYFGEMSVTDEEWNCFVQNRTKLDGRIVEVAYDQSDTQWKFMRFRDDKSRPNHSTVVDRILESIKDGVTEEELIAHASKIRDAWNQRKNHERGRQQHRERQEQEEFHYKHRKPQQQADAQRNTQTSVAQQPTPPHSDKSEPTVF